MSRKFRLDDVETDMIGMAPGIIREYSFKKNNHYSSDRTFLWMLGGCSCDNYVPCSCDEECRGEKGLGDDNITCGCNKH